MYAAQRPILCQSDWSDIELLSPLSRQVTHHGKKLSGSDGMTFSSAGKLYYGAFHLDAVLEWDPATPFTAANQHVLFANATTGQWVDTYAFDNKGHLVFTTNRLQRYFFVRGWLCCATAAADSEEVEGSHWGRLLNTLSRGLWTLAVARVPTCVSFTLTLGPTHVLPRCESAELAFFLPSHTALTFVACQQT